MRRRFVLFVCVLASVLAPVVAAADPGDLLRIFENPNPGPFDAWFGASIAVRGNNVLIAAPGAPDENGQGHSGAAYLFDASTGDLLRTFRSPDPTGWIGSRVATFGQDFLIYGSEGVYMFDGSTDELLRTFRDPVTSALGNAFGASLGVMGGNVLVGDELETAPGPYVTGAVYLFSGSTGELLRTFANPRPDRDLLFGESIAAVGPNILVGAPGTEPLDEHGVAYLLNGSTGEVLLTLENGHHNEEGDWTYDGWHFGRAVAAYGDDLLVAGESYTDSELSPVILFNGTTAEVVHRFMYPGFEHADQFGWSLTSVGEDVLVGSRQADDGRGGYLFDGATGDLLLTLHDPAFGFGGDERSDTYFGHSVAALGRDFLISAPGDDSDGENSGRVYLFQGVPEPCTLALLTAGGAVGLLGLSCRRRKEVEKHS